MNYLPLLFIFFSINCSLWMFPFTRYLSEFWFLYPLSRLIAVIKPQNTHVFFKYQLSLCDKLCWVVHCRVQHRAQCVSVLKMGILNSVAKHRNSINTWTQTCTHTHTHRHGVQYLIRAYTKCLTTLSFIYQHIFITEVKWKFCFYI